MSADRTRAVTEALLDAIGSRDLRRISRTLAPDVRWQNVPHPPVEGRDAVLAMLAAIVTWSEEVRWDVLSASYGSGVAWLERIDRFWIDGDEAAVACNGVLEVDVATGTVTAVRDYVDLSEWRARIGPVYERLQARPASVVVEHHLRAVGRGHPVEMAADYAFDAELVRTRMYRGSAEIADYFDGVPDRLDGRVVSFAPVVAVDDDQVDVEWSIGDRDGTVASGVDRMTVVAGRIRRHVVHLDGNDF